MTDLEKELCDCIYDAMAEMYSDTVHNFLKLRSDEFITRLYQYGWTDEFLDKYNDSIEQEKVFGEVVDIYYERGLQEKGPA